MGVTLLFPQRVIEKKAWAWVFALFAVYAPPDRASPLRGCHESRQQTTTTSSAPTSSKIRNHDIGPGGYYRGENGVQ